MASAYFGPHDGAVWFSKISSESEAIEKALWLAEYFADHGRFPDGPELNLSGEFSEECFVRVSCTAVASSLKVNRRPGLLRHGSSAKLKIFSEWSIH